MKKFFMMSLLALVTLVSQAQQNKLKVKDNSSSDRLEVKEYARSVGVFKSRPEINKDK